MKLIEIFRKNNLDEMQEQKLLHIEKNGFWLLYFMLAAEILVKIALGCAKKSLIGELICLVIVSIYILFMCVKNGIWDRHLKADPNTNFLVSLFVALLVAVFNTVVIFSRMKQRASWAGIAVTFLVNVLFTFVIAFFAMSILTFFCRKREEKLENEPEEDQHDRSN